MQNISETVIKVHNPGFYIIIRSCICIAHANASSIYYIVDRGRNGRVDYGANVFWGQRKAGKGLQHLGELHRKNIMNWWGMKTEHILMICRQKLLMIWSSHSPPHIYEEHYFSTEDFPTNIVGLKCFFSIRSSKYIIFERESRKK